LECRGLFYEVIVMETVKGSADLRSEFKGGIHLVVCPLHRIGSSQPREILRRKSERIPAGATERMPIGDSKAKMLLHCLFAYPAGRVVVPEGQRIIGVGTFVFDSANSLEELFFSFYDFHECL